MVDPYVLILGGAAILLATFLAGVVGFAYGLVALPLLLIIGVPLADVVVINLVVGLVTRLSVLARRHSDVNWSRAGLLVLGSLPGVALGILTRDLVESDTVQLGAGVVTLFAVAAIVRGAGRVRTSRTSPRLVLGAGSLGGFLGVTTSLNGIPPALLLTGDRATARSMVADLAVYFVAGNALTLVALSQSGQASATWVWSALGVWVPIGLAGYFAGVALGPRLPYALFRRLTIGVIVVSGLVSTVQAVRSMVP